MLKFKKIKLDIDEALKKKIEIICSFSGCKASFEPGSIITLDKTNLSYIEPNKAFIKDYLVLFFNYSNEVYINNLNNKTLIKDLESFLKKK